MARSSLGGPQTAVDQFSAQFESGSISAEANHYSNLIPLSVPGEGEQYAFEVDLDRCTGCKSCVTACHNLNGLDDDETWRSVGLLVGGSNAAPFQQTVTAACHHCVEPACLSGCPVKAYEKDPITGIVKHLDDQCIGCQYCVLKCPYEVPQYNERLGIVRKCDMCSDRLAVGEAPACVDACPSDAIAIRVVSRDEVVSDSETETFVPGAASPAYTLPSTRYKSEKAQPRNLVPANFFSVRSEIAHLPLVVMLVLTQLSVGALSIDLWLSRTHALPDPLLPFLSAAALGFGLLALAASTLHLGRPQYAHRALIGLGTSWMSREILAFGVFALFATLHAATDWLLLAPVWFTPSWLAPFAPAIADSRDALGLGAVATGMAGVICSVMIYVDTHRETWRASRTTLRFLATTATLGSATVLLVSLLAASWVDGVTTQQVAVAFGENLAALVAIVLVYEMVREFAGLRHARKPRRSAMKQRALLLAGELKPFAIVRFATGAFGTAASLLFIAAAREANPSDTLLLVLSSSIFLGAFATEFTERILFFAASVAPRMPGGQGA